jgi:hypothetical protein
MVSLQYSGKKYVNYYLLYYLKILSEQIITILMLSLQHKELSHKNFTDALTKWSGVFG